MLWNEFSFFVRHLAGEDITRIERAFRLAESSHSTQKRKSGEPYFTHPVAVATMLAEYGADADTLCGALLHDTVEDTDLTLDDIRSACGNDVASLVEGVTKLTVEELALGPSQNEKVETLRKMFTLMQHDVRIMVIKLMDRLHNMQTSSYLEPHSRVALAQETLDIYVKIADRLCMQDVRDELEGLCREALDADRFHTLQSMQQGSLTDGKAALLSMRRHIEERGEEHFLSHVELIFEHRQWDQLEAQMETAGVAITGNASVTVAFVCDSLDRCYQTLGVLHQLWPRENMSFQDFINVPAINGYRGLHTTVILPDGTRVRCKIRTQDMQAYARKGIATVCFGGRAEDIASYLPWTKGIEPLSATTTGRSNDFWESLKSDILGESMIIHGPADETAAIPKQSTTLDAAFYLFREQALYLTSIQVNGNTVPFHTRIGPAATISVSMHDSITVKREWLQWVQTSVATAIIRSAVSSLNSPRHVIDAGRSILQALMTKRRKGYIEEFDETFIAEAFMSEGYATSDMGFLAIGEGRLSAEKFYDALFGLRSPSHAFSRFAHTFLLQCSFATSALPDVTALVQSHATADLRPRTIRFRYNPTQDMGQCSMILSLKDPRRINEIAERIRRAGGMNVRMESILSYYGRYACLLLITVLWGLDPVFSKEILSGGIEPAAFSIVRAMSLFMFGLCVWAYYRRLIPATRIPLSYPSVWIAGVLFFLVNISTYFALQMGTATLYNTVLRGNALLFGIPLAFKLRQWRFLSITSVLGVAGYVLLFSSESLQQGLLFSLSTLLFFHLYTRASTRFQQSAHIQARFPSFFLFMTAISALCAMMLSSVISVHFPATIDVILLAMYCIGFVGVPYVLFYSLTRTIGYPKVSPWITISLCITFLAQGILSGTATIGITLASALFLVIAGLPFMRRSIQD